MVVEYAISYLSVSLINFAVFLLGLFNIPLPFSLLVVYIKYLFAFIRKKYGYKNISFVVGLTYTILALLPPFIGFKIFMISI